MKWTVATTHTHTQPMLLRQLVSKNADRSESGVGTTEYSVYEVFVLLVGHISIAEPNHVQIVIKWQN